MELDEFKNAWQGLKTPQTTADNVKTMLAESNHPILKGIRRQVIIEVTMWTIFLLCYYTMFDGDRKPLWLNAVLITSVLLPLLHNLMGYNFSRYLVNGATLATSLKNYLARVKAYAVVSVVSRTLFAAGLLVFFIYGLKLDATRLYTIAAVVLVFTFQLVVLWRLWAKRIHNINTSLQGFM